MVLERGRVYFFYRPRVQREQVLGLEEVQRFHLVLSPAGKPVWRLLTIGRKRLPEIDDGGERVWGFVELVADSPEAIAGELDRQAYGTKTRGVRVQAEARPAGQGVYAIASHDDHTHLSYVLELPQDPGPVQHDLKIEPQASYVVAVRNPSAPAPRWAPFGAPSPVRLPADLQAVFRDRRFAALSPELLDRAGVEVIFMGATRHADDELGIDFAPEEEPAVEAAMFEDLRIERDRYPLAPLFEGRWA